MKLRLLLAFVCALAVPALSGSPAIAQDRDRDHTRFDDRDRQILREWYRDHFDEDAFRGANHEQWDLRIEERLQAGSVIDPDIRRWVRPAPADLNNRLPRQSSNMRYVIIGDHVALIDEGWRLSDIYHFERFEPSNQQNMRDWYGQHRDAPEFEARRNWNENFENRIQPGMVLDPDLRKWAHPASAELLSRLPAQPRWRRYVVVGDHILLVDNNWYIREVFHFERP
jgi:hypothetical protein